MSNGGLHSIRFKRGGTEFELTSTADEVSSVRELLSDVVLAAFASDPGMDHSPAEGAESTGANAGGNGGSAGTSRRSRTRRRTQQPRGGQGREDERTTVREALASAPMDAFPAVGSRPGSLLAAFSVLSWARETLGIDGLTAPEIANFMDQRRRVKYTPSAYRQTLQKRIPEGEVDATGEPAVYRLLEAGDEKLTELIGELSANRET